MASATASIEAACSPAAFLAVVTDFERYPEFVDDLVDVRIRSHGEGVWEVAFGLQIVRRLEYTLRLEQVSPTRVQWSLLEGVFRANSGSWTLEALEDGGCKATYEVEIQLGMYVPKSLMKTLVGRALPEMLERFREQAEQTS